MWCENGDCVCLLNRIFLPFIITMLISCDVARSARTIAESIRSCHWRPLSANDKTASGPMTHCPPRKLASKPWIRINVSMITRNCSSPNGYFSYQYAANWKEMFPKVFLCYLVIVPLLQCTEMQWQSKTLNAVGCVWWFMIAFKSWRSFQSAEPSNQASSRFSDEKWRNCRWFLQFFRLWRAWKFESGVFLKLSNAPIMRLDFFH